MPVYPGSYWKYLNQNNDTVLQSTSPEYVLHHYCYRFNYPDKIMTDYVYVPFWNGVPVYAYSSPLSFWPGDEQYYQIAYLSEIQGKTWYDSGDKNGHGMYVVKNNDTTLLINSIEYNHVIKVSQYVCLNDENETVYQYEDNYYAKDIGLVLHHHFGDTLSIISYYINR